MRTFTFLSPLDLPEQEVAQFLEQRFGAVWIPEYHRCSIDTESAIVAVDVDRDFTPRLPPEDRATIVAQVGFVPRTAFHVQESIYHKGSSELARRVQELLESVFQGKELLEVSE